MENTNVPGGPQPLPPQNANASPLPPSTHPAPSAPLPPPPPPPLPPVSRIVPPPPPPPQPSRIPPPPIPEIDVRTMRSDIQSLKDTGGTLVKPEIVRLTPEGPKVQSPTTPKLPAQPPKPPETNKEEFKIPGYDSRPLAQSTPPSAPAKAQQGGPQATSAAPAHGSKKMLLSVTAVILFVIVLGAVGYFFVYPILFGSPETPAVAPPPPPPPPPEPPPPPPPPPSHVSLFVTQPAKSAEAAVPALQQKDIISSVTSAVPGLNLESGSIAEIVLRDSSQNLVTFAQAVHALMPEYALEELSALFEDSLSFAVFAKDGALWPVLVARVKNPAENVSGAVALLARIESPSFASLKSLFLEDPGNPDVAGFRAGVAENLPTRYVKFERPGAALNYGVSTEGLAYISTSYFGLVEAVKLNQPPVAPTPPPVEEAPSPAL